MRSACAASVMRLMPTSMTVAPGANVVGSDHGGASHGGDHDIGAADGFREIARFRMADGDGGVGVHEEQRHGLADDIAAAEDDGVRAFDWNFAAAENFHHAERGAGDEIGAAGDEAADVEGWKPSTSLAGSTASRIFLASTCAGSGSWTRMPSTSSRRLRSSTMASSSAGGNCGGRRDVETGEAEFFAWRRFCWLRRFWRRDFRRRGRRRGRGGCRRRGARRFRR